MPFEICATRLIFFILFSSHFLFLFSRNTYRFSQASWLANNGVLWHLIGSQGEAIKMLVKVIRVIPKTEFRSDEKSNMSPDKEDSAYNITTCPYKMRRNSRVDFRNSFTKQACPTEMRYLGFVPRTVVERPKRKQKFTLVLWPHTNILSARSLTYIKKAKFSDTDQRRHFFPLIIEFRIFRLKIPPTAVRSVRQLENDWTLKSFISWL